VEKCHFDAGSCIARAGSEATRIVASVQLIKRAPGDTITGSRVVNYDLIAERTGSGGKRPFDTGNHSNVPNTVGS